jgi:hypothetical protein
VAEKKEAVVPFERSVPSEAEPSKKLAVRPSERLVAEVAKIMDVIAVRLELETPHPSTASRVRGARTVPREFVLSMMSAAERRPDLPNLARFDSARARAVLADTDAYRLIAERMAMFLASLNYTIEARWAEVVTDAMITLSIATTMAKDRKNADLAAEVESLRRQLGRKGQKKKKKKGEKTEEKAE